jgi:hypothetical protein
MPNPQTETDVLIVGAEPVGRFLANECARRELRSRLVETRSSESVSSKALAIFSRACEISDMAGVVIPFLAMANRVTSVAVTFMDSEELVADLWLWQVKAIEEVIGWFSGAPLGGGVEVEIRPVLLDTYYHSKRHPVGRRSEGRRGVSRTRGQARPRDFRKLVSILLRS